MSRQDTIYASPLNDMVDFRFDERVVDVFPDMIQRSVPGYATIIANIGVLAARYAQAHTNLYDLGCSLGAVSLSMQQRVNNEGCEIIAIDNSKAMIDKAQQLFIRQAQSATSVTLHCQDIADAYIENASVVVMNFTLQFIPLAQRQPLIDRIYSGLKPGGILLLSEKLAFENKQTHQFLIDAHHDFKRANGYSDMEISQKRSALENVLIPETFLQHQQRLQSAGFSHTELWYQCFNFASMIAIK